MRQGWRLALVLGLVFASPAAAQVPAGSSSESAGAVQATLSWSEGELFAEDPRLSVMRDGAQALDVRLVDECEFCTNLSEPPGDALAVQDLDGEPEPEVFVTTYSGGAHCCTSVVIYRWDGERYRRLTGFFGNAGYTLEDLDGDGRPEFVTRDDRFAYRFTAYAFSILPPMVLSYGADREGVYALRDVTVGFPELIREEARATRRLYRRARRDGDVRGVVAAYVADQYLLGHKRAGKRFLRRALRRGHLAVDDGGIWKSGRAYVRDLKRFLRKSGY